MNRIVIIFLSLIFSQGIFAQGYKIDLKVNNLKDSTIYLVYHYGNVNMIGDSAKLDSNGELVFKGDKKLDGGVYFIVLPTGHYIDFLIDKDQEFKISCDTVNFLKTTRFEGSEQNSRFYRYKRFLAREYQIMAMLKEKQKSYLSKVDSLMMIEEQIQQRRNKIYLIKEDIIAKQPDSLLSVMIKSELPIIPPPAPQDASGNVDSTFAYRYVKKHYFDNINFSDSRLVRTLVLHNKIFSYLNQMVVYNPDSTIKEVDYIVDKAKENDKVYKFVVNSLLQYYLRSQVISDENVFVHIAEKYYLTGKTPWVSKEMQEKLRKDIDIRKRSLIGSLAPDFKMKNNKGKFVNLRDIQNRHVIIYFYNTDCEICKDVTPRLMNFYRIIKDRGVDIIAVYVGKDKKTWLKYIKDNDLQFVNLWDAKNSSGFRENYNINGTPKLFLLDEDQKIVLKRITVEQLMQYFNTIK